MKAKSRLKKSLKLEVGSLKLDKADLLNNRNSKFKPQTSWFIKYFRHLPTLLLSLQFYYLVYFIFIKVEPSQIRDYLLPHSYLPLQVAFFLSNFFLFTFVFLKTRRGLTTAFYLSLVLHLRLNFVVEPIWLLVLAIPFLIVELLATIIVRE